MKLTKIVLFYLEAKGTVNYQRGLVQQHSFAMTKTKCLMNKNLLNSD